MENNLLVIEGFGYNYGLNMSDTDTDDDGIKDGYELQNPRYIRYR